MKRLIQIVRKEGRKEGKKEGELKTSSPGHEANNLQA